MGYVTRPYQNHFPVTPLNVDSVVLDVPDPRLPAYLGFGLRTYVGGSPFVYVGTQLNRMVMTGDRTESLEAGGRALRMLDVLQKRHVRPDVCRALRGRVFYAGGDLDTARVELAAARAAFAAAGRVDPGTSLLLGLIAVRDERWRDAETVLAEAVAVAERSALGWRSLGVALSKQGRLAEAERAMGRAVALEPGVVAGWYNRGLLRLQRRQFARAVADLDRALRLDPENREVQRLLQMAAAGHKAAGGETVAVSSGPPPGHMADPDSLTALVTAQMEAVLAPPDSLRGGTPEADRRFRAFEAATLVDPAPDRRLALAQAYLDRNLLDSLQALLAPRWGEDLTDAEQLMLLWADRNLGEAARAEEATRRLLAAGPGEGNPWVLALAAETMRTSTDPVKAGRNSFSPHYNFFFWWKDAARSHQSGVRIFGAIPSYAVDLYRQYRDDPLFEDAVWGLVQTPVTDMNSGVGADGGLPTTKGSVR